MKARDRKIWLFGVFSACPLKVVLEGCPFEEFRKWPPLERWEYINRLSEEEVNTLIMQHKNCLYKRESGNQTHCPGAGELKKTG